MHRWKFLSAWLVYSALAIHIAHSQEGKLYYMAAAAVFFTFTFLCSFAPFLYSLTEVIASALSQILVITGQARPIFQGNMLCLLSS